MWGFTEYYYAQLTGLPQPSDAAGKVYVSTNTINQNRDDNVDDDNTTSSNANVTFNILAVPKSGYAFSKWEWGTIPSGVTPTIANAQNVSTTATVKTGTSSGESGARAYTINAVFVTYYAKVSVSAPNGSATVDGVATITKNTDSPSNQMSFNLNATKTSDNYVFGRWECAEGGNFNNALASTTTFSATPSDEENGTKEYNVIAHFYPVFKFSASATSTIESAGTATVTVAAATVVGADENATSATTTATLTATAKDPTHYTFKGWQSSTPNTTIDDPTALETTATITSTSYNPATNTDFVAVFERISPSSITLTVPSATMKQGGAQDLSYTLEPAEAYDDVTYVSSDPSVISVDPYGIIHARGVGSATITAKALKPDGTEAVSTTTTVNAEANPELPAPSTKSLTLSFSQGTLPSAATGNLFTQFSGTSTLTISDCLVMPGRRNKDGLELTDFVGTLQWGGATINSAFANTTQQVDCETFYFDTYSDAAWAYTFTGWHVVGQDSKIPSETVFQPGDVISPEVLDSLGVTFNADGSVSGSLSFEALWGKVCFADSEYGNDSNTGNDPNKPKKGYTSAIKAVANSTDAFAHVVMLTGQLDFNGAMVPEANKAVTYKSLQRRGTEMSDGARYILNATGTGGSQPHNKSNWRLDNVRGAFAASNQSFFSDDIYYLETTARFSGCIGQLVRLAYQSRDYIVTLNGGTVDNGETFSYQAESTFGHRKFYFGRNLNLDYNFSLGPSGQDYPKTTGTCTVTVTGGHIKRINGTNYNGRTFEGDRIYYLLGDGSGDYTNDPDVKELFPAYDATLTGSTYVNINGCTLLKDVYGGGYTYTGTVTGNANISVANSHIHGSVFGGGCFGSTQNKASVRITNSVIDGNVYGSGKGATSVIYTTERVAHYTTNPANSKKEYPYYGTETGASFTTTYPVTPPDYTPTYNTDDYSVMACKLALFTTWGGDPNSSYINFEDEVRTYTLSLATVGETDIEIANSTIGSSTEEPNLLSGNVYGGGAIAQVNNGTKISITNSTICSHVYGGGDGVSEPDPVRICPAVSKFDHTPDPYLARSRGSGASDYQRPNPEEDPEYGEDYYWSDSQEVREAGGIYKDGDKRLIYSPNMNGWGDVYGSTQVSITGNSVVCGSVYGGGNSGKLGKDSPVSTAVTVEDSEIRGEVFGGCNEAVVNGGTSVKVLGKSTVKGNVYGGGNAGAVTGKTKVQIGEE